MSDMVIGHIALATCIELSDLGHGTGTQQYPNAIIIGEYSALYCDGALWAAFPFSNKHILTEQVRLTLAVAANWLMFWGQCIIPLSNNNNGSQYMNWGNSYIFTILSHERLGIWCMVLILVLPSYSHQRRLSVWGQKNTTNTKHSPIALLDTHTTFHSVCLDLGRISIPALDSWVHLPVTINPSDKILFGANLDGILEVSWRFFNENKF